MAETWFTKLKAFDAHIATLQKTRAQGMAEAATWSKLREELERIVRRPNSDSKILPPLADDLVEQKLVETAKWMAQEREVWQNLRAEIETHRLRIRAELDAYRSRKRLAGKGPHSPNEKSSPKRP